MSNSRDLMVIDSVLRGNLHSYEELINKYKSRIYSLCLKLCRNEMEAEEIAHDAFLKALKNLSSFNRKAAFSTWLYRIAYNTCLNAMKKQKNNQVDINGINQEFFTDTESNPLELIIEADRVHYLKRALNELKKDENLLIDLYYRHGKDMNEIGEITGNSHGNVRIKLMRIRGKLLSILTGILKNETLNLRY